MPETWDSPLYPGLAAVLCETGVGPNMRIFLSVHARRSDSPLYPGFAAVLCEAGVGEAHVEEGREHKGEEGDRRSAHQVQNGSEAAHARGHKRSSFFEGSKPNQTGIFGKDQNQTKQGLFLKPQTKPN